MGDQPPCCEHERVTQLGFEPLQVVGDQQRADGGAPGEQARRSRVAREPIGRRVGDVERCRRARPHGGGSWSSSPLSGAGSVSSTLKGISDLADTPVVDSTASSAVPRHRIPEPRGLANSGIAVDEQRSATPGGVEHRCAARGLLIPADDLGIAQGSPDDTRVGA